MASRRSNGPPTIRASPSSEPRMTWNCTGSGASLRRTTCGSAATRYGSGRACEPASAPLAHSPAARAAVAVNGVCGNGIQELVDRERLLDERVEARVLRKRALMEGSAHHDDRCLAACGRTAFEELEPVDLGHRQIEHHDIRTELAAPIEPFGSVAGGRDDVAGLHECRHDHLASRTVVLHDEDPLQFLRRQGVASSAALR